MTTDDVERARKVAEKVVNLLIVNCANNPTDAMNALELVVASMLHRLGIPCARFVHRVNECLEIIRADEQSSKVGGRG